jgi:hypothetical protein
VEHNGCFAKYAVFSRRYCGSPLPVINGLQVLGMQDAISVSLWGMMRRLVVRYRRQLMEWWERAYHADGDLLLPKHDGPFFVTKSSPLWLPHTSVDCAANDSF